jgi:hypothetical protein
MSETSALDWNNAVIDLHRSRRGVAALPDPLQGVVRGRTGPWPPAELIQKLYRSERESAFDEPARTALTRRRYYCDLQSVHSEDALTWSVFGTLSREPASVRAGVMAELLRAIGIDVSPQDIGDAPDIWLWRRLPHPQTLASGGPEIDFALQGQRVLVLGEAKWRSPVGRGQGKDGRLDQVQIRQLAFEQWHAEFFPGYTTFVLLLVGRSSPGRRVDDNLPAGRVSVRSASWAELADLATHPLHEELVRYVDWKDRLSQP